MPRKENAELYAKYKQLADSTPGVHFVGRLATYKYYNMDQIVAQALTVYARLRGEKRAVAAVAQAGRVAAGNGHVSVNGNGSSRLPSNVTALPGR